MIRISGVIGGSQWRGHRDIWRPSVECTNPTICEWNNDIGWFLWIMKNCSLIQHHSHCIASSYRSADVYSFSMLFWEIMTLEKPLKDFTYTKLKNEIFIDGDRPPLKKVFNKNMRSLIEAGWSQNPKKRPSMSQVYDTLRDEYLRLSPGTITEGEVSHNRRRSTYVAAAMPHLSVRNLMRLNSAGSDHDTKKWKGKEK